MRLIGAEAGCDLSGIETVVFAGGGNRCWWQAGAVAHLLEQGWRLPNQLIGTSAGAAIAASCMTDGPTAALEANQRIRANNPHMIRRSPLSNHKLQFAHRHVYRAWLASFVTETNFDRLKRSRVQLRVGITRPSPALGLTGSVIAGTFAYLLNRYVHHDIHPRLPKSLGFRQGFYDLHECANVGEAHELLNATAAAPPLMAARQFEGEYALDGCYTDTAPVHRQSPTEESKTLVLLTLHYPDLPVVFRRGSRTYWQPSKSIPVSTWDCTNRSDVGGAFTLGKDDMINAIACGQLRLH